MGDRLRGNVCRPGRSHALPRSSQTLVNIETSFPPRRPKTSTPPGSLVREHDEGVKMQRWKAALVAAPFAASLTVSAWAQTSGSAGTVQSPGGFQGSSSSSGAAGSPYTTMLPNVPGLAPGNAVGTTPAGTANATIGSGPGAFPGRTSVTAAPQATGTTTGMTSSSGSAVTPNENAACPSLGAALGTATSVTDNCIP
jgi:hypothetical protein